jgi:hypothetical protein
MNNLEHMEQTESKTAVMHLDQSTNVLSPCFSGLSAAGETSRLPDFNGPRLKFPTTTERHDLFAHS